ncbi:MAG: GAF domain-containing protein [Methylophilaceae bacterium]
MDNSLIKLQDLSNFLEQGTLDENIQHLAELTAKILGAENSSIMLLNDGEPGDFKMRVCASFGFLPVEAFKESIGMDNSIAGCVVTTGKSLLIEDISQSIFFDKARRVSDPRKSLISSPITINKRIIGVVNVCSRLHGEVFTDADLNLLEVVALFIGKSIQAVQLQSILNSRFAQMALIKESGSSVEECVNVNSILATIHNRDKIAKILAKSFYKEMARTGLGPNQIISAASEIIAQLNSSLHRHNKRLTRGGN